MTTNHNLILQRLPAAVMHRFLDHCEPFELVAAATLNAPGTPLTHAYFPLSGFISLVVGIDQHPALEVGMVGREGVLGAELLLWGAHPSPWGTLVQGAGQCWRISAQTLGRAGTVPPELTQLLHLGMLVRMHQQAQAVACERFHTLGPRLARWLLMSQDRAQTDSFHMTQALMALMLGMRRVGVTVAAHEFQQQGLIAYHRGELTVLDREGLRAQACSCYATDQRIYNRLMHAHPPPAHRAGP